MPRAADPSLFGQQLPIDHDPLSRIDYRNAKSIFDLDALLEELKRFITDFLFPAIESLTGIDLSFLLPLLKLLDLDFSSPTAFFMSVIHSFMAIPEVLLELVIGIIGQITGMTGVDLTAFLPILDFLKLDFTDPFKFLASLWAAILALPEMISGLLGPLGDVLNFIWNPVLSISAIGSFFQNLLANPTFATADSMQGFGIWNWVSDIFHGLTGGAANVLGNGTYNEMVSEPATPVAPNQVFDVTHWVRWTGVNAVGPAFQLGLQTFTDVLGSVFHNETVIDTIADPPANSVNPGHDDFVQLSGSYTVTDPAVKSVRVHLIQTQNVTSGESWWSDGGLIPTQKMAPDFIQDLVEKLFHLDINGLFDAVGLKNLENIGMIAQEKIIGLIDHFQSLMGAITGIFDGTASIDDVINQFVGLIGGFFDASWLTNIFGIPTIPTGNVAGVGGALDIGQTLQTTWDFLWSGFTLLTGSNKTVADLANAAANTSSAAQMAIDSAQEASSILAIRNNQPIYLAVDEATESTFLMSQLIGSTDPPNFGVTQSTATMGYCRITESALKGFVTWFGKGFTSITAAFISIYKVNTTTGVHTLVHSSNDVSGMIGATWSYLQYFIPANARIQAEPGEVYGIELRVTGAGTHTIAGLQMPWLPDNALIRPKRPASVRNSGTGAAPATIADASVTYSGNQPWFGFGIQLGDIPPPVFLPRTTAITAAGPFVWPIPSWANVIDVIGVGGGGGGQAGTGAVISGDGGSPGNWNSTTLLRGSHFPTNATSLTGVVGDGGPGAGLGVIIGGNGSPGLATTVASGGSTLFTASGGGGGANFVNPDGAGPGNLTYKGTTYYGGITTAGPVLGGGQGSAPGGAGPGGQGVLFLGAPGANGAPGAVWFVANQS